MQTHYISGAWFDEKDKVTHVLMHRINPDGTFQFGVRANLAQVINAFQQENAVVKTIIWNYIQANWEIGPQVIKSQDHFLEYVTDNPEELKLENLIK